MTVYDYINGDSYQSDPTYFTLGDLIRCCEEHPDLPVKFIGTNKSPCCLISWRGSYDLPCIEPSDDVLTGKEVADAVRDGLTKTHRGYKGGEFRFFEAQDFYVADYGYASEYKVIDANVVDGTLILGTVIAPY